MSEPIVITIVVAIAVVAVILILVFRSGTASVRVSGPDGGEVELKGESGTDADTLDRGIEQSAIRARNVTARSRRGRIRQRVGWVAKDMNAEQR